MNLQKCLKAHLTHTYVKVAIQHLGWVVMIDGSQIGRLWINRSCDLYTQLVIIFLFYPGHPCKPSAILFGGEFLYTVDYTGKLFCLMHVYWYRTCTSCIPSLAWHIQTLLWIEVPTATYICIESAYICGFPFCMLGFAPLGS